MVSDVSDLTSQCLAHSEDLVPRFVDFIFTSDMDKNPRLLADVEAFVGQKCEDFDMFQGGSMGFLKFLGITKMTGFNV